MSWKDKIPFYNSMNHTTMDEADYEIVSEVTTETITHTFTLHCAKIYDDDRLIDEEFYTHRKSDGPFINFYENSWKVENSSRSTTTPYILGVEGEPNTYAENAFTYIKHAYNTEMIAVAEVEVEKKYKQYVGIEYPDGHMGELCKVRVIDGLNQKPTVNKLSEWEKRQ